MNPSSTKFYYVRSDSDPEHYYLVTTDARGLLRCECKSAQYRRTPCKHCRAVAAGSVRPATPKARTLADVNADLYGEPAAADRGRDLVMGGLREPAL